MSSNQALHLHSDQLSPLPTSGDDKWVAAKISGQLQEVFYFHQSVSVSVSVYKQKEQITK